MLGSWDPVELPNLSRQNCVVTSPTDPTYNCIAWAAGDNELWWWPHPDAYWPEGVANSLSIESFQAAFATLGYVRCPDGSLEEGHQKVAIFATQENGVAKPTHAARQLASGQWASKLGPLEDIEHTTPDAVSGPIYGVVVCFMKRMSGA